MRDYILRLCDRLSSSSSSLRIVFAPQHATLQNMQLRALWRLDINNAPVIRLLYQEVPTVVPSSETLPRRRPIVLFRSYTSHERYSCIFNENYRGSCCYCWFSIGLMQILRSYEFTR